MKKLRSKKGVRIKMLRAGDTSVIVHADGKIVIDGPRRGRSPYHLLFGWIFEGSKDGEDRRKDLFEAMFHDLREREAGRKAAGDALVAQLAAVPPTPMTFASDDSPLPVVGAPLIVLP